MTDISALSLNVIVIHAEHGVANAAGAALEELVGELVVLDVEVVRAASAADAILVAGGHANLHAALLDWAMTDRDDALDRTALIAAIRVRSEEIPVFLVADRRGVDTIPTDLLAAIEGVIYLFDDTADWIAGRVRDAALKYRTALLPPMFAALASFAETHEYSWHTPGHEGGAAFRKSAVGRAFWEFFGEQMFRSDLSISVAGLGSLLGHTGPIGESERQTAAIFGADMTFYVTNGTSTSNRIVHQGSTTCGDVVVCDRNAHKSIEQSNVMNHTLPVYMIPTRNRWGIIGPIPPSQMTADAIACKIAASPIVANGARPVLATVTNSTYDGLLCHVPTVDETLGSHIDRIHYDEAWYGYAAFNPIYHERHAMHTGRRGDHGPTTFATQSTHKLLAALSQASYVHVRKGRNAPDHERFNEAFMMHSTTSPNYAIIASNDVAAAMMKGRSGLHLTRDSITEAVAFRKTLARVARDISPDWMFTCWQPETVLDPSTGTEVAFADAPDAVLIDSAQAWQIRPGDSWHGFSGLPDGYAMLDPIKVTVLTPGIGADGQLEPTGVPAAIVSAYLQEHAGIVGEKTQDYSILFLFSMGVTRGKWGSLLTALLACKADLDANTALSAAMPTTFAADPQRYAGMGMADLAAQMHDTMRETSHMTALCDAYSCLPIQVMAPAEAYAHVVRGTVDVVRVDDICGSGDGAGCASGETGPRTVATGVVPYPPGIPLLMPGESAGCADGAFVVYLKALQEFDRRFPGFAHDIHGVDHVDGDYVVRCVARSDSPRAP